MRDQTFTTNSYLGIQSIKSLQVVDFTHVLQLRLFNCASIIMILTFVAAIAVTFAGHFYALLPALIYYLRERKAPTNEHEQLK